MKVYKAEVMVIDFDEVGEEGIKYEIENAKYSFYRVKSCESRDIGEWSDDHPLNHLDKQDAEYLRLFSQKEG